jgi:lipoyl(octanoyl) transferase
MEFVLKSPAASPTSSSKENAEGTSLVSDSACDSIPLPIEDWGCIDYSLALQRQMEEVEKIASQNLHGKIIFCTHPSVVTVGRATQDSDIFAWRGPIIQVSRGGRATYHGPEQIVIYPLVNLKKARRGRTTQDIAGLMRDLEQAIVASLLQIGVPAVGKSFQKSRTPESQEKNILPTGVWIGEQKVASLGLAVRQWVSFHGAAINFEITEFSFQGIHPCGYLSNVMTSVRQESNISRCEFENLLKKNILKFI